MQRNPQALVTSQPTNQPNQRTSRPAAHSPAGAFPDADSAEPWILPASVNASEECRKTLECVLSPDPAARPDAEALLADEKWVHVGLPGRAAPPPPPGLPTRPPGMPLPKLPGFVGALKPPVWNAEEAARPHAFLPEDDGPVFNGYVWPD